MILCDTSVWIQHFRSHDSTLAAALDDADILIHPFIVGELACGNLRNRGEIIGLLQELPNVRQATEQEVLEFIRARSLMGRGVGYIDMHLLASVVLTPGTTLWTYDRRLALVAVELRLV